MDEKMAVPESELKQILIVLCDAAERLEYKGVGTIFDVSELLVSHLKIDWGNSSPAAVAWHRVCDAMRPESEYGV